MGPPRDELLKKVAAHRNAYKDATYAVQLVKQEFEKLKKGDPSLLGFRPHHDRGNADATMFTTLTHQSVDNIIGEDAASRLNKALCQELNAVLVETVVPRTIRALKEDVAHHLRHANDAAFALAVEIEKELAK